MRICVCGFRCMVCICMGVHVYDGVHIEARGHLARVDSLLLQSGSQGLTDLYLGHQAWQQHLYLC